MGSYKMGKSPRYSKSPGASPGVYIDRGFEPQKKKRRTFKQWLRDYLKEENDQPFPTIEPAVSHNVNFNKSFEGWNIRLHRANSGHIVEAWKNEDGPVHQGSYKPQHELFMVQDTEDMGLRLNDILVQLMLRG
jgi:hypothetical protein